MNIFRQGYLGAHLPLVGVAIVIQDYKSCIQRTTVMLKRDADHRDINTRLTFKNLGSDPLTRYRHRHQYHFVIVKRSSLGVSCDGRHDDVGVAEVEERLVECKVNHRLDFRSF